MREYQLIIAMLGVVASVCGSPVLGAPSQHVDVRFGTHPGYDRLVIEFPKPVHPHIRQDRGTASISFDVPANLSVKRLQGLLPSTMAPVGVRADGMQLTFRIPQGRAIHDHSQGNLVILDIAGGPDSAPAAAPEQQAAAPAKPPSPPPAAETPASVGAPAPESPDEVDLASTADNQLTVTCAPIRAGFSFHFKWKHHAKLAVFKLRASVWIVFERAEQLKFNPQVQAKLHIPALHQVDNGSATVLELADPHYRRVTVNDVATQEVDESGAPVSEPSESGDQIPIPDVDWIVDLQEQTAHDAGGSDEGATVLASSDGFYPTRKPGQPVTLVDPDSGEVLLAIPVFTHEHFADQTDHKTYIALPTIQGLLFRPEGDLAHFLIERGKDENGVRIINAAPILTHTE